jgi:hypothetical protein
MPTAERQNGSRSSRHYAYALAVFGLGRSERIRSPLAGVSFELPEDPIAYQIDCELAIDGANDLIVDDQVGIGVVSKLDIPDQHARNAWALSLDVKPQADERESGGDLGEGMAADVVGMAISHAYGCLRSLGLGRRKRCGAHQCNCYR